MNKIPLTIHNLVTAVCPIHGIRLNRITDKSTWEILFDSSATLQQRNLALEAIKNFDISMEMSKEISDIRALSDDSFSIKKDPTVTLLAGMTPAQAKDWATANITSFQQAKDLLGTMAALASVIARKL